MLTGNVFIFGAGYSGRGFSAARPDHPGAMDGTTRSARGEAALRAAGVKPHLFDGKTVSDAVASKLAEAEALVVSIAPEEAGDPVLNAAGLLLEAGLPKLKWIGYLSTVGVYGDKGGAWIDETADCNPGSERSRLRVAAEDAWLALGERIGVPVAVLRLSGIYGPGRNAFVNLAEGTARRLVKKDQVFNRIHVEDIAGALWHLADRRLGGIFNVTDDLPAPPQDVVAYAATLMGVEAPPEIPFETAELSPMARSFYAENKRVSNAALKATGYAFRFPDYRTAFDAMWRDDNWRGGGRSDLRSPIRGS